MVVIGQMRWSYCRGGGRNCCIDGRAKMGLVQPWLAISLLAKRVCLCAHGRSYTAGTWLLRQRVFTRVLPPQQYIIKLPFSGVFYAVLISSPSPTIRTANNSTTIGIYIYIYIYPIQFIIVYLPVHIYIYSDFFFFWFLYIFEMPIQSRKPRDISGRYLLCSLRKGQTARGRKKSIQVKTHAKRTHLISEKGS